MNIYNPELDMSLAKWVEVNIVDPLTQGRHSLIRETALELARIVRSDPGCSTRSLPLHLSAKLPADPRIGTIPSQIVASLQFYPAILLALSSLVHIGMQKIDMGSLIRTSDELFVSEEEWVGKGIKERKARAKSDDKMNVDTAKPVKEEVPTYEMEGPEELNEVLDYVADVIVELDGRNRKGSTDNDSDDSEDTLTRNLRLNLLALAKRAPLDTIARLPMDLVPEHIRHFVPTLAT